VPEPTARALYLTRQYYRKTVLEEIIVVQNRQKIKIYPNSNNIIKIGALWEKLYRYT
jgi:hypothetical protein